MTPKVVPLDSVLAFEPGIRLKHDTVRDRYVIQGPEVLIELNEGPHSSRFMVPEAEPCNSSRAS